MAELVDARDLKSLGPRGCTGSIPVPGTRNINNIAGEEQVTQFLSGGRMAEIIPKTYRE